MEPLILAILPITSNHIHCVGLSALTEHPGLIVWVLVWVSRVTQLTQLIWVFIGWGLWWGLNEFLSAWHCDSWIVVCCLVRESSLLGTTSYVSWRISDCNKIPSSTFLSLEHMLPRWWVNMIPLGTLTTDSFNKPMIPLGTPTTDSFNKPMQKNKEYKKTLLYLQT